MPLVPVSCDLQGPKCQQSGAPDVDAGVVQNLLVFRAAMWRSGRARSLKAGEYRFTEPMSAARIPVRP